MRNDFMVLPPAEPHTRTNAATCGPTEITSSLGNATREGFTLNFTSTYGPAQPDCPTPVPATCTTKIEQIFKLVEFKCAAECFRGAMSVERDKLEIDCRCP